MSWASQNLHVYTHLLFANECKHGSKRGWIIRSSLPLTCTRFHCVSGFFLKALALPFFAAASFKSYGFSSFAHWLFSYDFLTYLPAHLRNFLMTRFTVMANGDWKTKQVAKSQLWVWTGVFPDQHLILYAPGAFFPSYTVTCSWKYEQNVVWECKVN